MDERIYWIYKPIGDNLIGEELKSRHAQMTSVWEIRPEQEIDWVPSPFPIELPARCIYSVLDEDKGRVIDPYAGSGTTLVAAKLMGHEYLGIEISPEYTRRALERIETANPELPALLAELEKHRIETTFEERKKRGDWNKRLASPAPQPSATQLRLVREPSLSLQSSEEEEH